MSAAPVHIGENKWDLREDHRIVVPSSKISESANIVLRRIECAVESRRLIVDDDIGKRGVVHGHTRTAQTSQPTEMELEKSRCVADGEFTERATSGRLSRPPKQ